MNSYERAEIKRLPKKYRPLGFWAYIFYSFLYSLPIAGIVFMIKHAISDKNINRRSYARVCAFSVLISLIMIIIVLILTYLNPNIKDMITNPPMDI